MEVTIKQNNEDKVIELKGVKGRQVKQLLKQASEIGDSENTSKCMMAYVEARDVVAAKISGMTVDELDDLDSDDKQKITSYVEKKVAKSVDFMNAS